jgi:nucleotidyltransferase substrate binding protein (TIGR01987 family)
MSGLVALYEICFEQAWKAMKEILEQQGFAEERTGSPKIVLKTAFSAGMIKDENLWMAALNARNNVAHSYNKEIALDIINQTKDEFYKMFEILKIELDENWV